MQLHELKRKTENKSAKRVGRGGGRGKTSGRGTKGQKARAGHRIRPDVREKLKKLPKLRGYAFGAVSRKSAVVNLSLIDKLFASGEQVSPQTLLERGAIRARKGERPSVKILGAGELTKKLTVVGCALSESAKKAIQKAGGTLG